MDPPHSGKDLSNTPTIPFATACANLPYDLFVWEILARLPVKHLLIYKDISPCWCAAIDDAAFVRRHREFSRESPPSMLIIPRKSSLEDDIELSEDIIFHRLHIGRTLDTFEEEKVELMLKKECPPGVEGITNKIFPTHCDGLVAIATVNDQVFVCNPATQELVALPRGTPDARIIKDPVAALGFDASRNQYVVARYFYWHYDVDESIGVLDYEIGHEVFMLGGDSWELTDCPPGVIVATPPVFVQGAFYWGTCANDDLQSGVLLRFNLRERNFDMVPYPPEFVYHDHLADLNGKLCYVSSVSESTYDVWQLEDDKIHQPKWSLRCRIDPFDEGLGVDAFFPVWAGAGRIMVAVDYEKLYWCEEKSGYMDEILEFEEETDLDLEDYNCYRYHVVPYMESLISIRVCNH
jgi:F-box interacting protein